VLLGQQATPLGAIGWVVNMACRKLVLAVRRDQALVCAARDRHALFAHGLATARCIASAAYTVGTTSNSKSRELRSSGREATRDCLNEPDDVLNSLLLLQPLRTATMRWYALRVIATPCPLAGARCTASAV
jgi:hypothetical protein